jgi:hypothetical protein
LLHSLSSFSTFTGQASTVLAVAVVVVLFHHCRLAHTT